MNTFCILFIGAVFLFFSTLAFEDVKMEEHSAHPKNLAWRGSEGTRVKRGWGYPGGFYGGYPGGYGGGYGGYGGYPSYGGGSYGSSSWGSYSSYRAGGYSSYNNGFWGK